MHYAGRTRFAAAFVVMVRDQVLSNQASLGFRRRRVALIREDGATLLRKEFL